MSLRAKAISQKQGNDFVRKHHRHHDPVRGDKFRVAAVASNCPGILLGVAQVARPVGRGLDDGHTVEVVRLAVASYTKSHLNVCSFLYARCCEAAKALGYTRIYTYTLAEEPGTSLIAAGWKYDGVVKGRSWTCKSRPRQTTAPTCDKIRWVKILAADFVGDSGMPVKFNENTKLCTECGGRCCKRMGCEVGVVDVFGKSEPTIEKLKDFLAAGGYAIDSWEGDPTSGGRQLTYFVRAANKGESNLYDPSWGGECVFLAPNGCTLDWKHRPYGGKSLVPHRPHCYTGYGKRDCAIDWYPYQWMFDAILEDRAFRCAIDPTHIGITITEDKEELE